MARYYKKVNHFPFFCFPHIDKLKPLVGDSIQLIQLGLYRASFYARFGQHILRVEFEPHPHPECLIYLLPKWYMSPFYVCVGHFSRNVMLEGCNFLYFPVFLGTHFYELIMLLALEFYELTIFIWPEYLIFSR